MQCLVFPAQTRRNAKVEPKSVVMSKASFIEGHKKREILWEVCNYMYHYERSVVHIYEFRMFISSEDVFVDCYGP